MNLLFVFSLLTTCLTFKMVIIAPSMPPSQIMFNTRVADALAKAGHDVTLTIMHALDDYDHDMVKKPKNVKIYHVNASTGDSLKEMEETQGDFIFQEQSFMDSKTRTWMGHLLGMFTRSCRAALRNKEFLNWLKESNFDLAFVHMYHTCPIGLAHAAGIPWIWLQSGGLMDFVADAVGVPMPPSYVPPMMMAAHDEMTFFQRSKSFIGHGLTRLIWPYLIPIPETQIFREEYDPNFPDLRDIAANCSLVMTNTHAFYELPRPQLAKIIQIGGIGAQLKDAKPLPEELENFVQKGEGAVVLTFGSVAPIHKAPIEWKNAILGAFARLPQYQFVMRYMADDLNDRLPPNVKIMKWLPQSDLLQHPRVKAFISHGGYNGMQETIAAGKPIVMIPLAGDQPKNAVVAQKLGISVTVQKSEINEEKLYTSIKEILINPSYTSTVIRLSKMVQKQPVSAEQLLVKWAEILAEFKNLDNLKPVGQKLNFFQYHSLDVIGALLTVLFLVLYLIFALLRFIISNLFKCITPKKAKKE